MDNLIQKSLSNIAKTVSERFGQATKGVTNFIGNNYNTIQQVSNLNPFGPKLPVAPKQAMQNYQNIGNTLNKLPNPVKKFGEGFTEASALGLYDMPMQKSQNNYDRAGYVGGYAAGMLNPLNPANKIFGALNIGQKATTGLLSKVAPQATGFIAKKLLPNIAGEATQTAGYMTLKKLSEQANLTPKNQGGFGEQLAYGLLGRGAFGIAGRGLGNKLKAVENKIGDDDVKAIGQIFKRSQTNWMEGKTANMKQFEKDLNLVDDILVSKYGATKEELKKIPEIDRVKNLFSMAMEDYRGYQLKKSGLVSNLVDRPGIEGLQMGIAGKPSTPQGGVQQMMTPVVTGKARLKVRMKPVEGVPEMKAPGKIRGFVETVQDSTKTQPELRQQLEGISNSTYTPKSNDVLTKEANRMIRENPILAERYVMENIDDKSVAISHKLIDYYSRTGNSEKAAELAIQTAERLTESGRAIQAASLYNKLTPAGIQRYAATQLSKFKQQLSPTDSKRLFDMAEKIQLMPAGEAKALAQKQLLEEVSKLVPTSFLRKTVTLWKANLLSGLKTTARNITSNSINAVTEQVKDAPATIVDVISSVFTGKRAKTFSTEGLGSGFVEGVGEGIKLFKTGVDTRNSLAKMDVLPINWGNSPVQKMAKAYTNTIFRFLGAQDKPFYYSRLRQSIIEQAKVEAMNMGKGGNKEVIRQLLENPSQKILKTAIKDAELAVFQQKNLLGKAASGLKRAFEKQANEGNLFAQAASAVGEFTLPFTGVPSGVAEQVLNYSPVGIVKTIMENIGKGKFNQRAFSEGLGRGITGTALMAVGKKLFDNGLITLEYPKDAKEQKQWELEGKKPYSILWDGKWRSIGSLGPQAQALLIGGHFARGGATDAGAGALTSQFEQTFLKGASSLMSAIQEPDKKGMSYIANIAGGFVPTIASDIGKSIDPYQREVNKTGDLKYLEDTIKNRLPIIRQKLLPKRNAFGEEMKNEPEGALQMIDIFNSSQAKTSPVIQELRRLLDIEEGATPTKIQTTQSIGGEKVKLSFELQDLLESKSGPVIKRIMEETIATPQYQALTDDKRQQLLQKIITDVRGVEKLKVTSGAKLAPEATAKAALDLNKNQQNYLMTGSLPLNYPSAPKTGTLPITQTDSINKILSGQTTAPGKISTTVGGVNFAQPTTELGKIELSRQIGEYTTKINDIYDMYKMGAMSEQDASAQISQLKAQQSTLRKSLYTKKLKAAPKVKKVAIRKAKTSTAKFKVKMPKLTKIKITKPKKYKMAKLPKLTKIRALAK